MFPFGSQLCIVTLALFETLVDLNCEDVMLELCLGALTPCSHVMLSQRRRLRDVDPFGRGAEKFLSLTPACCVSFSTSSSSNSSKSLPHVPSSLRRKSATSSSSNSTNAPDSFTSLPVPINYGSRHTESLYGNYHAYLYDARRKIISCQTACSTWSCRYDGEPHRQSKNRSAMTLADENGTLAEHVNLWRIDNEDSKFTISSSLNTSTMGPPLRTSTLMNESSSSCKNEATNGTDDFSNVEDSSAENILENIKSLLEGDEVGGLQVGFFNSSGLDSFLNANI